MHKKIIPFLLTFFLIFSSIPVSAYDAADEAKVVHAIKQREVSIRDVSASTQDLIGLKYRYPELFWANGLWQAYDDTVCISYPSNLRSGTIKKMRKRLNRKVKKIKRSIPKSLNKTKKVLAIFDYVATHTTYSLEADMAGTAYGALVNGKATCNGYTKTVALLLNKFGIKNGVMVSEKANHAWNVVYINGKWYHMDVTWADNDQNGINHDYFLMSEKKMFSLDNRRKDMVYYGHFNAPYKKSKNTKRGFWNETISSYYRKIKK